MAMFKLVVVLIFVLFFVACGSEESFETTGYEPQPQEIAGDEPPSSIYELCSICNHYHEPLRQPTPPINIYEGFALWQGADSTFPQEEHDANIAAFSTSVHDFENIHSVTYTQFETDWYGTIILWADSHLTDFSFVSLDVAGHYWDESGEYVKYVNE